MTVGGHQAGKGTARLIMVGELTVDDIVVEDVGVLWKEPGGGALYSALGALMWDARPIICAAVGSDYPKGLVDTLSDAGIDTAGITVIEGEGLGIWLLYERNGYRHQVPKASASSFERIDGARLGWNKVTAGHVDGVHIAPQTVNGQIAANRGVAKLGVLSTLDLMVEPYIDIDRYRTGEALRGVDAVLLNDVEARQIWGETDPRALRRKIISVSGVRYLVVKQGEHGAVVVTDDGAFHIPALSRDCIDPTGAGDAFSGGFLAGLVHTGDPIEAALCGAVSASIVVEVTGAMAALDRIQSIVIKERQMAGRSQVRVV